MRAGIVATVMALLALGCEPSVAPERSAAVREPILGGMPAGVNDVHGTVAIVDDTNELLCTGTLIAPTVVVTAAHCVLLTDAQDFIIGTIPASQVHIVAQALDVAAATPAQRFAVKKVVAHPDYPGAESNDPEGLGRDEDIAVLLASEPITVLEPVPVLRLDKLDAELHEGDPLVIAGYGTRKATSFATGVLYFAETPYVRRNDSELIAGAPGKPDTCPGDSGGPAYLMQTGKPVLIGATSRASATATKACGEGGVYTLVPGYDAWLKTITKGAFPGASDVVTSVGVSVGAGGGAPASASGAGGAAAAEESSSSNGCSAAPSTPGGSSTEGWGLAMVAALALSRIRFNGRRSRRLAAVTLRCAHLVSLLALAACGARTSLGGTGLPAGESQRPAVCGNHLVERNEQCDDGNEDTTDACVACRFARCGDGFVQAGVEACDDRNANDADGCRNNCALPSCGDGIVQGDEVCDDGNASDTDACTTRCLPAQCGDGFVQSGVEACDGGPANDDRPPLLLTQGALQRPVRPVARAASVTAFYDYHSASAHTGFEAVSASRLYLYRDTQSGVLSLVTHHGIDFDGTGIAQPKSQVRQNISFLPPVTIAINDDNPDEFRFTSISSIAGDWGFHENTDGGALSGLPFPGNWSIDVASDFVQGVTTWSYVDGDSALVALQTASVASLSAFAKAAACRRDCTVPRCGDGRLDAGEICDDANTAGGDGCAADCLSL
jgi:MYXO-CTERM domain-containing protein